MSSVSILQDHDPLGRALTISGEPNFDSKTFVYYVDLFLVALLGIAVLVSIPRAIALFGTSTEWCNGIVLLSSSTKRRASTLDAQEEQLEFNMSRGGSVRGKESSVWCRTTVLSLCARERQHSGYVRTKIMVPLHIPACPPPLRPFLRILRFRVLPGYSLAQLLLLAMYTGVIAFASLYRSNIFVDATRTGWVALSQYAFVFLFGAKNNLFGALIGRGYEKLNYIHRLSGRVLFILVNLHGIHHLYKWTLKGAFMHHALMPRNLWGVVALVCVDMLFFFSTTYWRRTAYNLFHFTHIIGFTLLLPATYLHRSTGTHPYILSAAAVLAFDYLLRLLRSRIATAILLHLPELRATRICIPMITSGWRAGQHVRLRVLSSEMGWKGWAEVHPFTVVSISGGGEGLVLIASRAGDWTGRLAMMVAEGKVRVVVEGPYGGPGHTVFASFSAALFVVGGSGITFALGVIPDLIRNDHEGRSRLKVIDLHWAVQDPTSLISLLPALTALLQSVSVSHDTISTTGQHIAWLTISVYYTRPPASDLPHISVRNLVLVPGRPQISSALDMALTQAVLPGPGAKRTLGASGVLVGVCGPVGMGDDVVRAVRGISPKRREQVGGVEIHEEVFGW